MSCYSCTENFGMFRREHSCMRCHLSFCSKCLPNKAVVPNKGSKAQHVCRACYKILSTPPDPEKENSTNQARLSPPENFKRRMEALAAKEPRAKGQHHVPPPSGNSNMSKGLEPKDRDIVERLNKLKEGRKKQQGKIPSTEEMEERLRALKGFPTSPETPSTSQATKPYFTPDNRNLHEQFSDLMDEMSAEVKLEGSAENKGDDDLQTIPDTKNNSEGKPKENDKVLEEDIKRLMKESEEELKRAKQQDEADADMAARLASLQGLDPEKAKMNFKSKGVSYDASSDEDEEMATKRFLQKLAEEEKLNDKLKASGNEGVLRQADQKENTKEEGYTVDPDELPWCCICNEDATLRCHGCEGDLYCQRCFKEGHGDFDHDHKTERYKPPKNKHN